MYPRPSTWEQYYEEITSKEFLNKPKLLISYYQYKSRKLTELFSSLSTLNNQKQYDLLVIGSYVIVHSRNLKHPPLKTEGTCTASAFKRNSSLLWHNVGHIHYMTTAWDDEQKLQIWKHPFRLKAQTFSDMNYGNEYRWGELIVEGNRYGDTSDFYVIGELKYS